MLETIKNMFFKVKSYWNKPPKGYDVSYKEFVNYAVGSGGMSFLSVLVSCTTVAATADMMIGHFDISTGAAFILATVLGSIIALIRAPILSMIIDNSNDKSGRGKFKPLIMWTAIAAAACFVLIPFIPKGWVEVTLAKVKIPSIPLFLIEAQTVDLSVGIVMMFLLMQVGTFFYTLFTQAMTGIDQTISTVSQERANLISIKGLISNIPSSIMNLSLPILAGIFFASTGKMLNINLYRIIFPITAILGIVCCLFMLKTKERVIVNKKYKSKVKFFEGAKELSKNKYFWIITIFNVFLAIRAAASIVNWIRQFTYADNTLAATVVGIFNTTILMSILIVGMVTAPLLIKIVGKRKLMMVSNIGFAVFMFLQLVVYKSPVLILFATLFQNLFNGYAFVANIMVTDVLDYQQWRTGKRLEGFWQNYSSFILTLFGIFTALLTPLFLSFAGVNFGDKVSDALNDAVIRNQAYKYISILGLIGSLLCLIPMSFYDLDEKKHANYVRVLKLRVAVDNFKANEMTDGDILNLWDIMIFADKNKENISKTNKILFDEFQKIDNINEMVADYAVVKARTDAKNRKEDMEAFIRDIDLEGKRIDSKVQRGKNLAIKTKKAFDEDKMLLEQKQKSRFFKFFVEDETTNLDSAEKIIENADAAYDYYSAKKQHQDDVAAFIREIALEDKKITSKVNKAKKAAQKDIRVLAEEKAFLEFKQQSKVFKYFVDGSIADLDTKEKIMANAETAYAHYTEKLKNETEVE